MLKGNRKYIALFAAIFLMVMAGQYFIPKPIDWRRTYQNKDKIPFGSYAIFNLLNNTFARNVTTNKQTLYNLNNSNQPNSTLFIANASINFNTSDLTALFSLLNKGNDVFIAANEIEGELADTFKLATSVRFYPWFEHPDSLFSKEGMRLKLLAKNAVKKEYVYNKVSYDYEFSNFDTTRFSVVSVNEDKNPVLIKTKVGKGNLYFMSVPDVFGNFYIVNHPNRFYAYAILSLLNKPTFIWDEYYKTYNVKKDSFLKFILTSDALYAAWMILLITVILYMVFEGRRRQRAIPVIPPVTNTTLEFVNVVSHVYFNSNNHKHIAEERIRYFYEDIRRRFNIPTHTIDDHFYQLLHQLSGVTHSDVKQLFSYCERIKKFEDLNEPELIELNRLIINFNKNSLR